MLEYQQAECFESDGREFAKEATGELQLVLDPEFLLGVLATQTLFAPGFPVQFAVRAVGPLQGGESSSVRDFRTAYALLGPKIVKLVVVRSDDVGFPSIQLQKGRQRC